MKREKFDLVKALNEIFKVEKATMDTLNRLNKILKETGLTKDEFWEVAIDKQSIGNLKYRILGVMDKKKIDSSHII